MARTFHSALITGITGSGGSYLAEYLVEKQPGLKIHGISRWRNPNAKSNIEKIKNKVTVHECDLNHFDTVKQVLEKTKPDVIFNIASNADVRGSFLRPQEILSNNIIGTANLFEAVHQLKQDPVVQHCSTSEVYGQVDPKHVPINEETPIQPTSPYAVSKTAQDFLGLTYFKSYGMKIIRTRMFSYLNPRREDLFATSFAMQIARIEAGKQEELLHGNLDSVRTLIDVRDAMEAYWLAAVHCLPGEVYNMGGETKITVGEFLEVLKKLSKVKIKTRQDPNLLRPADVTLQIPDSSKFFKATGWKPKYSFEQSVAFLLEHCREKVREMSHS